MQYLLFVVLAPIAASFCLGVTVYAWHHRRVLAAAALGWCSLCVSGWLICNTLELLLPSDAGTLFWAKLTYVFIGWAPVAWMAFALDYTGQQWWRAPSRFWLLFIFPTILTVLTLTNDTHHLIWARYSFHAESGLLAMWVDARGPWFWVHTVHSYGLVGVGALLIGREYLASHPLYRRQSAWAIAGAVLPLAVNLVYLSRLVPGFRKDYTPIAWALGGVAFSIAIFRHRLFDLTPIARKVLVDCIPDGVLILDRHEQILDINPAAQTILGVSADRAIGCSAREVWSEWSDRADRLRGAADAEVEIAMGPEGKQRIYDVRALPLRDRRKRLTGHLVLLCDVTRRKETEELLRRSNLDLEARNADLDVFARTVAHDLETPLTVVSISTEMIVERIGASDPELHNIARAAARGASHASEIVRGLLLLARAGRVAIPLEPLDMALHVEKAQERLVALINECRPVLIQPEPADWPPALGYGPWVVDLWVNYISNALKYGGQPPRIELGADANWSGQVRFWVRDNGPGLTAEEQARLFVPFERLGQTGSVGHGLGLSIVSRIVDKLGGQAGVESAPGQGSLFYFTLPRAKAKAGGAQSDSRP